MLGYPTNINSDKCPVILKSSIRFLKKMISLKDITIIFYNTNINNKNRWIRNRRITGTGESKKECYICPTQEETKRVFIIDMFLSHIFP